MLASFSVTSMAENVYREKGGYCPPYRDEVIEKRGEPP